MINSLKELWPFLRLLLPHWRWMAAGTLCGLITMVATVGLLALSGWFLSAAAHAGLSLVTSQAFNYFYPSIGVRIFAISRTLTRYLDRIVSHDATFRQLEGLRVWFYQHLEPLAPARLMTFRSGDILNRIVADIDALDNLYLRVLSPSIVAIVLAFLLAGFLWIYSPWAAVMAIGFYTIAGFGVPAAAGRIGAETGRELTRRTALLRIQIVEGIQGLAELTVFGRIRDYLDSIQRQNRNLIASQKRMAHIRGFSNALITLLMGAAVAAVLYHGALLVNRGLLNGALLAMVALAVLAAFDAVMVLPNAFQYLGQTHAAGKRLREIVDTDVEVRFPDHAAAQPSGGHLDMENLFFYYRPEDPPAISDVTLHIDFGQRIAIVGATGSGKSTLVNLLVRFWNPTSGHIRIGGIDIDQFNESRLRQIFGVVSQQAHLFNASIRDNLLIAKPDATDVELWDALTAAQLDEFVEGLPDRLDTWIGEAGKLVSGGQARRLAVARIILKDAPIWVLDEPTEGLDATTAGRLMNRLFEHTSGKTLILITHHTNDLRLMDRVVMFDGGKILAQGRHEQLLARQPQYRSLFARLV